jgi:hypothetical protein
VKLPFTIEQFLGVFTAYNHAIWPAQIVAYALGVAVVIAAISGFRHAGRFISGALALYWIWVGVAYHLLHFRSINPPATVFGALFILQGLLFAILGLFASRLHFKATPGARGVAGGLCILYAMIIYPLLGLTFGHAYPQSPVFGVAPCPLLIFTFGLLLWTATRFPWHLLIVPVLWALLGISAATVLGIREDFGLPISCLMTIILLVIRGRRDRQHDALTKSGTAEMAVS